MNVNEEFDNSVELPVENMSKAAFAQWVTGVNSEVLELYYLKVFIILSLRERKKENLLPVEGLTSHALFVSSV